MLKNVDENEKYVAKGYANVFHGIGTNIGRTESGEAFPMLYPHGVGNSSPDASHASATVASGMPLPTFFSDIFCTSGQPSMTSLMHHSPDMSTNCSHSPSCGPSTWVPNQGLLSSLVVYPTPDPISHPQKVADFPLG
ncbi:hypothetical protein E6C27_scaffold548G001050 [Cucumis melo var. makuwa]|uniref:Uncharacterized protein n=1 Tax=Cucumis melo var. makuwa TaxID=1194695 RepID=A0A5A7VAX8_CUCMM|nr:hypothetical protein E6C27_scaffold548G001050 [Cucumis melo var. makuwa]